MKNKVIYFSGAAVVLVLLLFATYGLPSQIFSEPNIKVQLVVTKNFGKDLMFSEVVEVRLGSSAMDVVKKTTEVETKYGGFVYAINDVRSEYSGIGSAMKDWFYYVNGILAGVGALDYKPYDGDIEHWDFHDWSFYASIPAIVGDFPEPFLHGYGGKIPKTIIVYEDGFEGEALQLKDKLTDFGVNEVSIKTMVNLSDNEKKHSNLVLMGTKDFQPVSELNMIYDKVGFYVYFRNGEMVMLDCEGKIREKFVSGGVIQAAQNPWNPKGILASENVVWMVSGLSEDDVDSVVNVLVKHYDEIRYFFAVVVVDGKVKGVPLC